ncbi:MG2 domain-containing protein [Escherichia coli]
MFGPRDLYRPGETVILNGLLRDADGKALPNQTIKLDVIKPDGQVLRSVVSQPENGLYHFPGHSIAMRQPVCGIFALTRAITSIGCGISTSKILCQAHGAESDR